jgi:hypothetical protein
MRKSRINLKAAVFCLACLLLLLTAETGAVGEAVDTGVVRNKVLIVSSKTDQAVTVGERPFMVTGETKIFNQYGKQISLAELAVPCEAMVQYRLIMDKSPVVVRLQVKKQLPGATVSPLLHLREK